MGRLYHPTQLYIMVCFSSTRKPSFSWLVQVIGQAWAIACTSCQGLLLFVTAMGAKFKRNSLIQDNISFAHWNVVNVLNAYKLDTWSRDLNTDFTLGDWLFASVKLMILINVNVVVMVLDLMHVHNFYFQMMNRVKMLLFLELITVLPHILIIRKKYLSAWWRPNARIKWYCDNSRS